MKEMEITFDEVRIDIKTNVIYSDAIKIELI